MSYEGYRQVLCKNGHYHTYDCYEWNYGGFGGAEEGWQCPICGEGMAWDHSVDLTNGSYCSCLRESSLDEEEGCEYCDHGRIDGYVDLEIDKEAVKCTCESCGHVHVVEVETYKIPEGRLRALEEEDG